MPDNLNRAAVKRLADMASKGAPSGRVRVAAQALISSWRTQGAGLSALRDRIADLQADVDAGVLAAEDFVATAEAEPERRAAVAQLDALRAIRGVIDENLDFLLVRPLSALPT